MNDSFNKIYIGYDSYRATTAATIFEVSTWVQNGSGNYGLMHSSWPSYQRSDTSCYIGFRCKRDDKNYYYGWLNLRYYINGTNAIYMVKEIARWNVPNKPIKAGQKS